MLLQEVRQSDAGTDGDTRMFQHESICQYGTDGNTGQSMQFNKDEVSKEAGQLSRVQKKNPTMKEFEYKTSLMKEKRAKLYATVITKCVANEDLLTIPAEI